MQTVYLSLGSNLDNRLLNLEAALLRISQSISPIEAVSRVYSSRASMMKEALSPDFYNIACRIKTNLSPEIILSLINSLEQSMGRQRDHAKSSKGALSRSLDVDILFYGNEIINTIDLELPHSKIYERDFVILPFGDVVLDGWQDPITHLTYNQILQNFQAGSFPENVFSNFAHNFGTYIKS